MRRYHGALISSLSHGVFMLTAQLINIYMHAVIYVVFFVQSLHNMAYKRRNQSPAFTPPCRSKSLKKESGTRVNSVSESESCGARLSNPKKQSSGFRRVPSRGWCFLWLVCFCLFIGSNGWSLMACRLQNVVTIERFATAQENDFGSHCKDAGLIMTRRKIQTRYNLWLLCLHCSMGAPLVLIDLGSRFYC